MGKYFDFTIFVDGDVGVVGAQVDSDGGTLVVYFLDQLEPCFCCLHQSRV